ncbi:ferredoxin Fer [Halomarina salina]|uniref:Ferredoxin Fer n=1 Tax=Halomarina salina TaxID=1872699 RepID=A0ABD5RM95_9EURY
MDSPFEVLDIDSEASDAEVERAYRRRVLEAHPDHGGSAREFQQVRAAYETLQRKGIEGVDAAELDGDGESPDADGSDSPDEADSGTESDAEADPEPEGARVEYLDYQALADRGWELTDEDLFEKAAEADLSPSAYGTFVAPPHDSLLEAAEENDLTWPYACRGGACSNCAVAVVEGEMSMPNDHILPEKWLDRGIRLSCLGAPISDGMKVVFNVKHLPGLDDLRLPPSTFDKARLND